MISPKDEKQKFQLLNNGHRSENPRKRRNYGCYGLFLKYRTLIENRTLEAQKKISSGFARPYHLPPP